MSNGVKHSPNIIKPQGGPQEQFLSTHADIAIYGGAAGGGKTFALLMEPLRHVANPDFGAVIFRRESTQITNEGGLWDTSEALYAQLGAEPRVSPHHDWTFSSGARVSFRHLQYDKHVFSWQGSQVPLVCFDELTHFSEKQFWYMLSRNRSMCGVRPYVRATTNPDADSWVARLIDWWIGDDGLPIQDRSGVVRWFVKIDGEIIWGASKESLEETLLQTMPDAESMPEPKSLTFIPARLEDNRILMEKDPGYKANLQALPKVERERLAGGNWKVRETAGEVFDRSKFEVVDSLPCEISAQVRFWDLAATNDGGDWTAGVKMSRGDDGNFYIIDVSRGQYAPGAVKATIKTTAGQDGYGCTVGLPQDPGQAGKAQAEDFAKDLAEFVVELRSPTGSKLTRAMPFAAAVENGIVKLLRGPWNDAFLAEVHAFTGRGSSETDDQVDAASDAYITLTRKRQTFDVF